MINTGLNSRIGTPRPRFTLVLLASGLLLRLRLAWLTFLNPDEALHFFLAHRPSLRMAYRASLTTAHPPLMVLLLHEWIRLGDSEFVLRLPFVIAGTLFCWTMFRWVERIAGGGAGITTLAILLFSPPLIFLSAEVRQYSLLLLFCAGCLYFLELAFEDQSAKWMALSMAALCLATLTHYSALIFAAAAGLYGLLRLLRSRLPAALTALWIAGQAGALAICGFLYFTQIFQLRASGLTSEIASTWLRGSIFHPGEDHIATFAVSKTVRLFRYLFSQGTVGVLALGLFFFAIVLLIRNHDADQNKPTPRELAILFVSPFVVALAAALAGLYPYAGTRHDVVLAVFAMPAIAIGLDRMNLGRSPSRTWVKPLGLAVALLICNFFPSPSGPYISSKNQNKKLIMDAVASLKSAPAGSVIFSDFQGSLVLNYYLCGKSSSTVPIDATPSLKQSRCGDFSLTTSAVTQQGFDRAAFPETLEHAWQITVPGKKLWLFQAGWIDDKQPEWIAELRSLGCEAPRNFGPNILICSLHRSNR